MLCNLVILSVVLLKFCGKISYQDLIGLIWKPKQFNWFDMDSYEDETRVEVGGESLNNEDMKHRLKSKQVNKSFIFSYIVGTCLNVNMNNSIRK